ncbi:MAG: hypothetical protein ABI645_10325 [Pseudomonadota bacterium]
MNWPDSYVGRLQRAADDAFGANTLEFMNAAAGGWGTSDYVAYYEDYGSDLEVQTVVVFINTDDIGRSVKSNIYSMSGGTLQRSPPRQSSRLKRIVNSIPLYQIALENSHVLQLLRVVVLGSRHSESTGLPTEYDATPIPLSIGNDSEVSTQLAKELFRRMFRLSRERRHKLIVLTTGWHKFKAFEPSEPTAAFMKIADQFFRENGIHFTDLSPEVYEMSQGRVGSISIKNDGHPDEFGARLISCAAWGVLSNALK